MDNPAEGIVKVQAEGSDPSPVAFPQAPSQGRSAPAAPAPEVLRDSVDISAAAQAASEASAKALKVQAQIRNAAGGGGSPGAEASSVPDLAPNIRFNYNKEVGILQAAVVDPNTQKVIRQIPPDEVLKMGLRFRNFVKEHVDAAQKVSDPATVGFESGEEGDAAGESAA